VVGSSPLFVACTTSGTTCTDRQPITAKPSIGPVGTDQGTGVMVYFGTGKYFETSDNVVSTSPQVQTFYGLWDNNTGAIADRADIQEQTIDFEGTPVNAEDETSSSIIRLTSRNTVCYSVTSSISETDNSIICTASNLKKGWAMNLLKPIDTAQGERVISPAIFYRDLVIFSTLIPSPDPCESGGDSRVMLLDALTGNRPLTSSFDLFGTGKKVDEHDLVKLNDKLYAASGLSLNINIHKNISIIGNFGFASGSNSELGQLTLDPGSNLTGSGTRKSWRQLR